MNDRGSEPSPLDQLYAEFARTEQLHGESQQQLRQNRAELLSREQELQAEQAQAESEGDAARSRQVSDELDELTRALRVVNDHLDDTDNGAQEHENRNRDGRRSDG